MVLSVVVIAVADFGVAVLIGTFIKAFSSPIAAYAVYWVVTLMLAAIFAVVGVYILKNKAEPLYDMIGERGFRTRVRWKRNMTTGKNGLLR